MDPWQSMREQFSALGNLVYLNHAAVSPLPARCVVQAQAFLDELSTYGAARYPGVAAQVVARAHELGASLMSTSAERVFVVRSTTQGLGIVVTGLPWQDGDNVVLVQREFPANLRPWTVLRRRGVELRMVPPKPDGRIAIDDLAAAADDRTRAISISFVQFTTGFRIDVAAVAEIARRHDALFVLDAIQGLGALPLDVEAAGVDFVSADAHKWLLSLEGVGLGYASDRALERIEPAVEGWLAVEEPFDFFNLDQPLRADAGRFEEGTLNIMGLHGMVGSLELLLSLGVANIEARILTLTDELAWGLARIGWTVLSPRDHGSEKSGIILATADGVDVDALRERLRDAGIIISVRDGALRISPHAYNNSEDLARLLDALAG